MNIISDDLRAQAAELRRQAKQLDAMAERIAGGAPAAEFSGNTKARLIIQEVCAEFGLSVELVLSKDRHDEVVVCRDICTHALRQLLGLRQAALAAALRRPTHSVCSYALRRVRERRLVDKHFANQLERGIKAANAALETLEEMSA